MHTVSHHRKRAEKLLTAAATHRLQKLATLEFDRERKTMSVICCPETNGKVATRSRRGKGNQLLVKGAAECVLQRCTQVCSHTHTPQPFA